MSRSIHVLAAMLAVRDASGSFPDEDDLTFAVREPSGTPLGAARLFVGEAKAQTLASAVEAWAAQIRVWSLAELEAAIPDALAAYDRAAAK